MKNAALVCLLFCVAACQNPRVSQKTGSELSSDGKKSTYVTYVTPEEYARMTQAERDRVHAAVGAEASAQLWGSGKPPSEAVATSDLDKAMAGAKADKK